MSLDRSITHAGACAVSVPEVVIPKEEPVIKERQYIGAVSIPYYKNTISEG